VQASALRLPITHKLFISRIPKLVDKLLISCVLRVRNDVQSAVYGLYVRGFLPTMKLQHIAVANDCWFRARQYSTRPFFLAGCSNSIT
ncbi:hypothetical protein, partial [Candidatus Skiveiella danica]|uniref:hypothetical protein n=1 Tax=Candidatus Skiveiella danica TaxID=3386177 RepID=UPI0039B835B7